MKKRSDTSGGAKKQREPVFFLDRDLGKRFAETLRKAGLRVEIHDAHFPGPEPVPDAEWLAFVGNKGWIAVSHDRSQIVRKEERDAVMRSGVKAFYVIGSAPYPELAQAFVDALDEITGLVTRHTDPFIAKVYKPSPGQPKKVRLVLTYARWLKLL